MKQHPILFSTPMVQAILQGNKTQTRRTRKLEEINERASDWVTPFGNLHGDKWVFTAEHGEAKQVRVTCPYGQVGDILWVREKFETDTDGTVKFFANNIEVEHNSAYRILTKWKPSIHMPKAACRIWLQITDIRVERLQNISEQDAIAEGVERWVEERLRSKPTHYKVYYYDDDDDSTYSSSAITSYETLWQKINGKDSWNLNPWVWVIEFQKVEKP